MTEKDEGLNREVIGKKYGRKPIEATREMMQKYALATNDQNPWYLDDNREGGIVAPPLFAMKLLVEVMFDIITDPELNADMLRLVHGEQDMTFFSPIRPGDVLEPRGEIISIADKSSGQLCISRLSLYKNDNLFIDANASFFIRAKKKPGDKPKTKKEKKPAPALPEFIFNEPMKVTEDQPYRYAEASGDNNPIHINPEVALKAGLGGIILQGLCTMAFSSQAAIKHPGQGDPTKLHRLKLRFSGIVRPKDELITQGYPMDEKDGTLIYGFRTINQEEKEVLSSGIAEIKK